MSLKKSFFHRGDNTVCRVTFYLDKEAASEARSVFLVGDFNDWDPEATPMRKLKNGSFSKSLDLEINQKYHFRYLVDAERWENDWEADFYEASPISNAENSVVFTSEKPL